MNKKDKIAVVLFIVAIIAVIACVDYSIDNSNKNIPSMDNGKHNTYIDLPVGADMSGPSVEFYLKDGDDNSIANQTVSVTYPVNNQDKTVNGTTDERGYCKISVKDIDSGFVEAIIKYGGDSEHNPCQTSYSFANVKV